MTSLTDMIVIGIAIIGSHTIATGITALQEYRTLTQSHPQISRKRKLKRAIARTIFQEETATYSGLISATAMITYLCTAGLNYR